MFKDTPIAIRQIIFLLNTNASERTSNSSAVFFDNFNLIDILSLKITFDDLRTIKFTYGVFFTDELIEQF